MAGYTRQSSAQILSGEIVSAAPLNAEFNQVLAALNNSTGHKHDGTAAEGPPIDRVADADQLNKVLVDTSNNHLEFYVQVSSASVEQIKIQDGAIVPVTDNDIDLGTGSLEFKDLHLDGTANIDALVADTADINGGTVDGAAIGGTSASSGAFTTISATESFRYPMEVLVLLPLLIQVILITVFILILPMNLATPLLEPLKLPSQMV